MRNYTGLIIGTLVVAVLFGLAWRYGVLTRLVRYFAETREELRKCTWPTREELWGSTVLVVVATALLGIFTVVVDLTFGLVVHWLI